METWTLSRWGYDQTALEQVREGNDTPLDSSYTDWWDTRTKVEPSKGYLY